MALADTIEEMQKPSSHKLCSHQNLKTDSEEYQTAIKLIEGEFSSLDNQCKGKLIAQGFLASDVTSQLYLNMRYDGTDNALMIKKESDSWDFLTPFLETHQREFGFLLTDRDIVIDDIRVRAIAHVSGIPTPHILSPADLERLVHSQDHPDFIIEDCKPQDSTEVILEDGKHKVPIFNLHAQTMGHGKLGKVLGPALLLDDTQTILLYGGTTAFISTETIYIHQSLNETRRKVQSSADSPDPVSLSVFSHRFMSIAEQMGITLQRTSVSTNIKERLDFSCALFDPEGGLVANAPHIPVHLGRYIVMS
jgi:5-oxoprolinase (ATP-hydrolysing)